MPVYLGLFASAFLAATLLPLSSEMLLTALLALGHKPWLLWAAATLGNTLGSALNWVLGRFLLTYQAHPWFPVKTENLARAQRWFQRFGVWSLLFAWLPLVGDGLTFIAGTLRVRFWQFAALTAIGKGARYAVLIALVGLGV